MPQEFLVDDDGEIKQQKYRIQRAVSSEENRRRSQHVQIKQTAAEVGSMPAKSVSVRQLTKYEQHRMDAIPTRQRQNLVQKQVVCGKEYTGTGFLSEPREVDFIDFVVGRTYKMKVQLTNVSRSFNAFKVMDVPPSVRDMLEVQYTPQSMMSAGMACHITVVFTPKVNDDMDTVIPILAKTGPIEIPVHCRRRRVVVEPSVKRLDFGTVVVAEEVTLPLTLTNNGALPTVFTMSGEIEETLQLTHPDVIHGNAPKAVLRIEPDKLSNLSIDPFSTATFHLTYSPMERGELSSAMFFSFDSADVDDVVVLIEGTAVDVPTFVDEGSACLDFQCCYYNCLYRDRILVRNMSKTAARVQPEIPPQLRGCLEYVPKFGFAQPDGAVLEFQVKFTPNTGLDDGVDVPLCIRVQGQTMPIFSRLKASFSKSGLTFTPGSLQYGYCGGELISKPLTITNHSRLARRIGFTRVPHNVKIDPLQVFTLTPGESVTTDVAVQPSEAGAFAHTLQVRTDRDETYGIELAGHHRPSPLVIQAPRIVFPACAQGDQKSATTVLRNISNTPQQFSFDINPSYGIQISPNSGDIGPQSSIPLAVVFTPTRDIVFPVVPTMEDTEEDDKPLEEAVRPPSKAAKRKTAKEEEAERLQREKEAQERKERAERRRQERLAALKALESVLPWEPSAEGEPWSRHRSVPVLCYIKGWSCKAICLNVGCTVVLPALVAELVPEAVAASADAVKSPLASPNSNATASAVQSPEKPQSARAEFDPEVVAKHATVPSIDFGDIPALHSVTRTIRVKNIGSKTTDVTVPPPDPFGPLAIVKPPLNTLRPGQLCDVVVRFTPRMKGVYAQQLTFLSSATNNIIVPTLGEGLTASLTIGLDKGAPISDDVINVDMGASLLGEKVERELSFHNTSAFPLQVHIHVPQETVSVLNANGAVPFSFAPAKFTIPVKDKVDVVCTFSPDVEYEHFIATASVVFGGDGAERHLKLSGHGWSKGVYAQIPNTLATMPWTQAGQLPSVDHYAPLGDYHTPNVFPLDFVCVSGTPSATKVIVVGNNKSSTNGEYIFEGLADADAKMGWKVDPPRGALQPGLRTNVTITFSPTAALFDTLPIVGVGIVHQCTLKLSLRGGTPAVDAAMSLVLKGTAWKAEEK